MRIITVEIQSWSTADKNRYTNSKKLLSISPISKTDKQTTKPNKLSSQINFLLLHITIYKKKLPLN